MVCYSDTFWKNRDAPRFEYMAWDEQADTVSVEGEKKNITLPLCLVGLHFSGMLYQILNLINFDVT